MHRHKRAVAAALVGCAVGAGSARAADWTVEPSLGALATYTDNAGFDQRASREEDVIVEASPTVRLLGVGKRLRITGTIGATAVGYAKGTRKDRVLPVADLTANLEAIERFFFVEAAVVARQTRADVFGPRPDGAADLNTIITTQYRVVPSFRGRLGANIQYELRSANSWTDVSGAATDTDGAYLGEHSLRIERRPLRLGWAIEAARSDTRFESAVPPRATVDSGRLIVSYAFSPGLSIGLRGGYERTNVVVRDNEQTIHGGELRWRPTERTNFEALAERRFFGTGWRLRFEHRRPRLAWNIAMSRDVASFPQAFLTLPPTDNVAALLGAAFTTRIPDEAQRNRFVADLIARQGLPSALPSETTLFSQRLTIRTSRTGTVVLVGIRNSLALSVFSGKSEELPDSIFALAQAAGVNVKDEGASATLAHQLTPLTSLNVTAVRARTRGIGADAGPESNQTLARAQVTRQLGPRTTGQVGARVQRFESSGVPGVVEEARERAAFAGITHRF